MKEKIGYLQKISTYVLKRYKFGDELSTCRQFLKSLTLFSWILITPTILLHPRSWEPNSTLNVPCRQFYTLQQGVHLQTY